MPDTADDWIDKRIKAAQEAHPVNDEVVSAIKDRLGSDLRERALRPAEITQLANSLLALVNQPEKGADP